MTTLNSWKPSPALKASAAIHAGAIAALAINPASLPWAAAALLGNHALLTVAGLWPRSALLGKNRLSLSPAAAHQQQIAITIDDGPDPEVTPLVLDILDKAKASASFFCIGERVVAYPDIAREIIKRGHGIENHSYTHRHHFSLMGMKAMRLEIERAQDAIAHVTDKRPQYFRAPAGLRNPFLDPILQSLGLELVSWTRRGFDTVRQDPQQVLQRLTRNLEAGDILLMHDGHCAKTVSGVPVVLEVLPALLEHIHTKGLHTTALDLAAKP